MDSGRFDTKIETTRGQADTGSGRDADAQCGLLGNAVEQGTEQQWQPGGLGPFAAQPIYCLVGQIEHHGSDGQSERDGPAAAGPEALFGEFEGDAGDQCSGAEAENQADESSIPGSDHAGDGTEKQ